MLIISVPGSAVVAYFSYRNSLNRSKTILCYSQLILDLYSAFPVQSFSDFDKKVDLELSQVAF